MIFIANPLQICRLCALYKCGVVLLFFGIAVFAPFQGKLVEKLALRVREILGNYAQILLHRLNFWMVVLQPAIYF